MEFFALFILITGFIIGLGAVTVIDLHGFLGRNSNYWTLATTRTHKVTKPLIWIGTIFTIIGEFLFYKIYKISFVTYIHIILMLMLIINGYFLSFKVSPFLLKREKEGREQELLPKRLQTKITVSFLISFVGWWTSLVLFIYLIVNK
jgi:hypothetical protein